LEGKGNIILIPP